MAGKRTNRNADQWRSIMADHEQSGLSATAFCKARELGYPSFMAWRRRLASQRLPEDSSKPAFIELTSPQPLLDASASTPMPSHTVSSEAPTIIELSLGGGVQLRITRGL